MDCTSMEADSEASYCERETWDDWGSRSSLSHVEEERNRWRFTRYNLMPIVDVEWTFNFVRAEVLSSSKNGMISHTLAGTRTASGEPPRSTAYYYADLEKLKKTKPAPEAIETKDLQNELSEYVEANEVINDGAVREVPPLRDRIWSLPQYNTPENGRKFEETYSTAGTFPMPEPKEKEPLLAELEVVGRLPLTQLDSSPGVRRSRSWYLCCPNVAEEEISRESSWRYSSLRPVTAPPAPGQNGFHQMIASQASERDDINALKVERDALARALAAERQRAATAARAHDARLAELHGVIAELVRRRAAQKQSTAIPEEELSDECESTTQPAGELDNDADLSRTEQNDTSSALSPAELPTPQEPRPPDPSPGTDDCGAHEAHGVGRPCLAESPLPPEPDTSAPDTSAPDMSAPDTSLDLSERDSELCLSTARCCQQARADSGGSCERERGSPALYPSPKVLYAAGCGARQAKLASRVRLRRTEDTDSNHVDDDQAWRAAAESLALDVAAHADLSEAMLRPKDDCSWRVRFLQSESSAAVARGALSRCADACRRLYCACGELEAACTAVCEALRAADRALEAYDVLLALAETANLESSSQRAAAEAVAWQLLRRLQLEQASAPAAPAQPLLSPGPWLQQPDEEPSGHRTPAPWGPTQEAQLRAHAAALKAHTVALRRHANNPTLYSHHDIDEEDIPKTSGVFSMAEMEAAVMLEEMLSARVATASRRPHEHKSETSRSRRRRERHWREAHASETDL